MSITGPIRLVLLLVLGALPCAGATDLEKADRLREEGRHAAAEKAYRAIIERDRWALPASAPALVRWVECCRRGAADPAVAAEYARSAPRFLVQPPPLDGADALSEQTAREDLLWKPWKGAAAITFSTARGKPVRTVHTSNDNGRVTKHPNWIFVPDVVYDEGFVLPSRRGTLVEMKDVAAVNRDGATLTGATWIGQIGPPPPKGAKASLTTFVFPADEPAPLARISGTVRITQATAWTETRMPLQVGQTWRRRTETVTITELKKQDGKLQVVCRVEPVGKPAEAAPAPVSATDVPSTSSSPEQLLTHLKLLHLHRGVWVPTDSILGYWDQDVLDNYWLEDRQRPRTHPGHAMHLQQKHDGVTRIAMTLSFPLEGISDSAQLVSCERSAPSSREFPVEWVAP